MVGTGALDAPRVRSLQLDARSDPAFLTTDVAVFPLLWVVPLALYLLTFILAFSGASRVFAGAASALVPVAAVAVAMLLALETRQLIVPQFAIHLLGLVVFGLACHGRLAAERPETPRLTEYYLMISVGGVLGGCFNALLAPVLFIGIVEYPVAIVAACFLRRRTDPKGAVQHRWLPRRDDWLVPCLVLAVAVAAPAIGDRLELEGHLWGVPWTRLVPAGLPAAVCLMFAPAPMRFGLGMAALMVAPKIFPPDGEILYAERTFFGVHRVVRQPDGSGSWHHLMHGTTKHGSQYDQEPWASTPSTYFTNSGPLGDVLRVLERGGKPRRLAILGLGAGSFAAHGRPDWQLTYYEIDPAVVRIALSPTLFTYVTRSRSPIDFVLGDARLRLGAAADGLYHLIIADAFSSDAVPVHLITLEAVQLYLEKLAPGGLITFNVTNRHLDLSPVLSRAAAELDLTAMMRDDRQVTVENWTQQKLPSRWVVLARTEADLGPLARDPRWVRLEPRPGMRVWTDSYSSVLSVLK